MRKLLLIILFFAAFSCNKETPDHGIDWYILGDWYIENVSTMPVASDKGIDPATLYRKSDILRFDSKFFTIQSLAKKVDYKLTDIGLNTNDGKTYKFTGDTNIKSGKMEIIVTSDNSIQTLMLMHLK